MSESTLSRSYYASNVSDFLEAATDTILGSLVAQSSFAVEPTQRDAWVSEIAILQAALPGTEGAVFLEFGVPRIGSRIDAVLISGPAVFAIEFKVGERQITTGDFNQVWDYALDLKNFHLASHASPIIPILVPTEAADFTPALLPAAEDGVYPPVTCTAARLREAINLGLADVTGPTLDPWAWAASPYQPTPTIIEAAQALYSQHTVESIARHDAGAKNLGQTSASVEAIIDEARMAGRRAVVFVTGVPGAGKTLVGLNVATKRRDESPTHAVFLSGNGPLVKVLSEALARDEMARLRSNKDKTRKGDVRQKIKAFIQNVHHFRDEGLNHPAPPSDHVVIFDEAQRAWNLEMTADFMRRKKGRPGFTQSEPEFLLSYLGRHQDWAAVLCLVGGGQEINRGEAGISAWLDAVAKSEANWTAYISPNLTDSEYETADALAHLRRTATVVEDERLHLSVSMRSFRAEHVSRFVKALLDLEVDEA